MQVFYKRIGEKLGYAIDWAAVLANENDGDGDTIAIDGSDWVISPSGLTKVGDAIDNANTRCVIRVSGGADNTVYTLVNTITLDQTGDILEATIEIRVVE